MKRDIILSGVGGQGILSIATVIGRAALYILPDFFRCQPAFVGKSVCTSSRPKSTA